MNTNFRSVIGLKLTKWLYVCTDFVLVYDENTNPEKVEKQCAFRESCEQLGLEWYCSVRHCTSSSIPVYYIDYWMQPKHYNTRCT